MDVRQLEYFLKVASMLHFTKASEELYVAQPALSRHIKLLEEELQVVLFKRDNRNVELTEAGKYFKIEIEQLLKRLDKVCKRALEIHKGEAGEIRMGYSNSAMQTFLPGLISGLQHQLPAIKTILLELSNSAQITSLQNKEIDLGFAPNIIVPDFLKSTVLLRDNFVVVLPKDHPISDKNYTDFSVFANEKFILPPRSAGSLYVANLESICLDAGFFPKIVHETAYTTSSLRLVESGIGITIEPKCCLHGQSLNIKFIELSDIPQKMELVMFWHNDLEHEQPLFFNVISSLVNKQVKEISS